MKRIRSGAISRCLQSYTVLRCRGALPRARAQEDPVMTLGHSIDEETPLVMAGSRCASVSDSACTQTSAFPLGPAGNWRSCAAPPPARRWRRSVCRACRTGGSCTASGTAGATERRTLCSSRSNSWRSWPPWCHRPNSTWYAITRCLLRQLEETRCSSSTRWYGSR